MEPSVPFREFVVWCVATSSRVPLRFYGNHPRKSLCPQQKQRSQKSRLEFVKWKDQEIVLVRGFFDCIWKLYFSLNRTREISLKFLLFFWTEVFELSRKQAAKNTSRWKNNNSLEASSRTSYLIACRHQLTFQAALSDSIKSIHLPCILCKPNNIHPHIQSHTISFNPTGTASKRREGSKVFIIFISWGMISLWIRREGKEGTKRQNTELKPTTNTGEKKNLLDDMRMRATMGISTDSQCFFLEDR